MNRLVEDFLNCDDLIYFRHTSEVISNLELALSIQKNLRLLEVVRLKKSIKSGRGTGNGFLDFIIMEFDLDETKMKLWGDIHERFRHHRGEVVLIVEHGESTERRTSRGVIFGGIYTELTLGRINDTKMTFRPPGRLIKFPVEERNIIFMKASEYTQEPRVEVGNFPSPHVLRRLFSRLNVPLEIKDEAQWLYAMKQPMKAIILIGYSEIESWLTEINHQELNESFSSMVELLKQ